MKFDTTHCETEHVCDDKTEASGQVAEQLDEACGGLTREELRAIVVEMIG